MTRDQKKYAAIKAGDKEMPKEVCDYCGRSIEDGYEVVNYNGKIGRLHSECVDALQSQGDPAPQPADEIVAGLLLRGIEYCAELADEGTPWESVAEPEPQYFATFLEAYDFQIELAATPQGTPELELEQESDGRCLAAYTRFPGVAAYGPSKEEAIRNAAKVLIESEALPYEKAWPIIRRALGLPEDHPDGSDILPRIEELKAASGQASPMPEKPKSDYCHETWWRHECGISAAHPMCRCVLCGESYPNREWQSGEVERG